MTRYDFDRLGDNEFEQMCQSLLKVIIGPGTTTFGGTRDGGREATFEGQAPYPTATKGWDGNWVFQVKYHDTRLLGSDKARATILQDIKKELEKIVKNGVKCQNYVMMTNVSLSTTPGSGTIDKAKEIGAFVAPGISHLEVWGEQELARHLDNSEAIRKAYHHLITLGDLVEEIRDSIGGKSELKDTMRMYLSSPSDSEKYAQLDQAGDVGDAKMLLQDVFVDLDVLVDERFVNAPDAHISWKMPPWIREGMARDQHVSALKVLLSDEVSHIMLIGGPGQGKSTIGQFLSIIHRSAILNQKVMIGGAELKPKNARIPFRIPLKEFAQEVSEDNGFSIEQFLASRISERAGGREVTVEDVHQVLKGTRCLIILDGLDEVTDKNLQRNMLERIEEFFARCGDPLKADIQVLATTRPMGYEEQFDRRSYLHLSLGNMTREKVIEYVGRWLAVKNLDQEKARLIRDGIRESLEDPQIRSLMNTPLQVTILILIILSGGRPPKQREALFDDYLEVIYKRESAKAKFIIRTDKKLLVGLHNYLGYVLHSRAESSEHVRSVLTEPQFVAEVTKYLRSRDSYLSDEELTSRVNQILRESRNRLVLIVEPSPGIFGFELRPIQEFFASGHLANAEHTRERYRRFEAISRRPHWRNVALFFAGKVGRLYSEEGSNIVQICRNVDRIAPDNILRRGASLAMGLAVDRSLIPEEELQRDLIEQALTLLDSDLRVGTAEVRKALTELSRVDVTKHLQPVMEERFPNLSRATLMGYLEVYLSIVGFTEVGINYLESYLNSDDATEKTWGYETSISLGAPPEWFSQRLWNYFKESDAASISAQFSSSFMERMDLMYSYLSGFPFSEELAEHILKKTTSLMQFYSPRYGYAQLFSSGSLGKSESKIDSEFWLSMQLISLLSNYWDYLGHRNYGYNQRQFDDPRKSFVKEASNLLKGVQVKLLLESEETILHLKALLLVVELWKTDADSAWNAVVFVRKSTAPLRSLLIRSAAAVDFSLSLILKNDVLFSSIESKDRLQEMLASLKMIEGKVENVLQVAPPHTRQALWRGFQLHEDFVVKTTDETVLKMLAEIEQSLHVGRREATKILLEFCGQHFGSGHRKLSSDEGRQCMDILADSLESGDVERRGRRLLQNTYFFQSLQGVEGISDSLGEFVHRLETKPDGAVRNEMVVSLCYQVIGQRVFDEGLMRRLLQMLPVGRKDIGIATRSYSQELMEMAMQRLSRIAGTSTGKIQRSALIFASVVIQGELRYSRQRVTKRRSHFSIEMVRKLGQEDGSESRIAQAYLLILTKFKIAKESLWIMRLMEKCDTEQEAIAWVAFLGRWRPSNDWSKFLVLVIKKRSMKQTVRAGAFRGYETVVKNSKLSPIQEAQLGLPLKTR